MKAPLLLIVVACLACSPGQEDEPAPPNIVIVLSDDAGYGDFGAYGSEEFSTPNIDALAGQGIRFTQGYVSASVCSPSRAGLLTGRYQQRFGHEFNIPLRPQPGTTVPDMGLTLSERTLAQALGELGYHTGVIGKWHLGVSPPYHPQQRGFDEFYGFLYGSRSYFAIDGRMERGRRILRGTERQPEPDGYLTDAFTDEAVEFIRRYHQAPFFLYVSYNAVHTPMDAKPDQVQALAGIEDENRRTLGAMTMALDEGVGRIIETLSEMGIEENTLLVFLNDNGGAEINYSQNGPLRGMKGDKFEGGIRVPFIARWPGALPEGLEYDRPVSALDIFPTALAATGADSLPAELDGVNLLPYLKGDVEGDPHEYLFWRRGVIAAVRKGDWKYIRVPGHTGWLFDMATDFHETTNRVEERPDVRDELIRALEEWEEGLKEPRWRTDPVWTRNQLRKHGAAPAGAR